LHLATAVILYCARKKLDREKESGKRIDKSRIMINPACIGLDITTFTVINNGKYEI